jgi:hypothetical protein
MIQRGSPGRVRGVGAGAKARPFVGRLLARLKSCPDARWEVEVHGFPPIAKNAMDGALGLFAGETFFKIIYSKQI